MLQVSIKQTSREKRLNEQIMPLKDSTESDGRSGEGWLRQTDPKWRRWPCARLYSEAPIELFGSLEKRCLLKRARFCKRSATSQSALGILQSLLRI